MILLFYQAPGTLYDKGIRWWTGSPYSHVEAVLPGWSGDIGDPCPMISSSPRDGGVRDQTILLKPGHWVVLDVPRSKAADEASFELMLGERGRPYDFEGIFLTQIIPLGIHDRLAWFCSELVACALGLDEPHRYSPGSLFRTLTTQSPARLAA